MQHTIMRYVYYTKGIKDRQADIDKVTLYFQNPISIFNQFSGTIMPVLK